MVFKEMRRKEVVAALVGSGCVLPREGARHTVFRCQCGEHSAPLPRHGVISAGVVASIERQMACLPKGWLT